MLLNFYLFTFRNLFYVRRQAALLLRQIVMFMLIRSETLSALDYLT